MNDKEKEEKKITIEESINNAKNQIVKYMQSAYPDIIDHTQGKKLRGALSIVVSDCFGGDHEKAVKYGSAIEFIHQGSLLHDDVIDEHTTRRGKPSTFITEGIKKALLVGDILFTQAMTIGAESGSEEAKIVAKAISNTLKGVLKEITIPNAIDVILSGKVEDDLYYKICDLKTAALFAASAQFGMMSYTDKVSWVDDMFKWGLYVGRAYQIADDLVDIDMLSSGKADINPTTVIPVVPAIIKYNQDIIKRAPFQLLRGNLGIDTLISNLTELDLTEKMLSDVKENLKQADMILENYISAMKDGCMIKQYPTFAINKMLEEIGEKI